MKKIILASLLLTPVLLAAQSPTGPACTAEAMRFFPKERVEFLIGPSSMMGMGTEGCLYQAGVEKMFNGAFLSKSGQEVDFAFDAYAQANQGKVVEGNSCDRYATSEGYKSLAITAERGNHLFIISSSIGLEDLIDAAEYACAQVAGADSSEATGPFSSNYGGGMEETSVTPGFEYLASLFMPILIGLIVLVAIGLIAWSIMHKKKATYQVPTNMMPPPIAPVPPRSPAPVATPVFTPPTPPPPPTPAAQPTPIFTPPTPPSFVPPTPPTPPAPPTPSMPPSQTPPPSTPQ